MKSVLKAMLRITTIALVLFVAWGAWSLVAPMTRMTADPDATDPWGNKGRADSMLLK